ncbi:MAG: hypothetical protein ACKOX7_04875 [Bacteroidota bacterium]
MNKLKYVTQRDWEKYGLNIMVPISPLSEHPETQVDLCIWKTDHPTEVVERI